MNKRGNGSQVLHMWMTYGPHIFRTGELLQAGGQVVMSVLPYHQNAARTGR
jgi:hypothetical protein